VCLCDVDARRGRRRRAFTRLHQADGGRLTTHQSTSESLFTHGISVISTILVDREQGPWSDKSWGSAWTSCYEKRTGGKVKVKVHTLDIAPLRSDYPPQKRSGNARVLKGFHSFTAHPHVHSQSEWAIPAFAFPAIAGTHLPTTERWKAE